MRVIFKYVLTMVALCVAAVVFIIANPTSVGAAEEVFSWAGRPTLTTSQHEVSSVPSGTDTCPVSVLPIFVVGESGLRESCVYGGADGLWLARYYNSSGQVSYAVAYASDSMFVPVRNLCVGMMWCAYSQSEDLLVMESPISSWESGTILVEDFSRLLVRYSDGGRHYLFQAPGKLNYLGAHASHRFQTGSVGISENGRWALVELRGYGVARVDLRSLELRRIAMTAHGYGVSDVPSLLEVSITDDGRRMALAGRGVRPYVYEIMNDCGDRPGELLSPSILLGYQECGVTALPQPSVASSSQWTSVPRFTTMGDKLMMYSVLNSQVQFKTITPVQSGAVQNPLYVAFGDSFSSGEGETDDVYYGESNTALNRCHLSSRSYPYLLGEYWSIVTKSLACSGSRTSDVLKAKRQLMQTNPGIQPSVMSLGIGGNDIDLVGKLKSCLAPGTCEWARLDRRAASVKEIRSLLPGIVDTLNRLRSGIAPAPVFVVGYPTIISYDANASCDPLLSVFLDAEERRYMHETMLYLNTILQQAAYYAKAHFVDTSHAFEGERLCEGAQRAMNGIRTGDDIAPIPLLGDLKLIGAESFHPTPYGHESIYRSSIENMQAFWENPYCSSCWMDEAALTPGPYWRPGESAQWLDVRQLSATFLGSTQLAGGATVPFTFLAGTFAPSAVVSVELHSQTYALGRFSAAADGSLNGELTIPPGVSGFHTVHVLGESPSGESLDLYETVFIEEVSGVNSSDSIETGTGGEVLRQEEDSREKLPAANIQASNLEQAAASELGVSNSNTIGAQRPEPKENLAARGNFTLLVIVSSVLLLVFFSALYALKKRRLRKSTSSVGD